MTATPWVPDLPPKAVRDLVRRALHSDDELDRAEAVAILEQQELPVSATAILIATRRQTSRRELGLAETGS